MSTPSGLLTGEELVEGVNLGSLLQSFASAGRLLRVLQLHEARDCLIESRANRLVVARALARKILGRGGRYNTLIYLVCVGVSPRYYRPAIADIACFVR